MASSGTTNDWQCGKTLPQCLDHVFTSGTASDVTFLVGQDRKRISAHKLILISRSPVFYAMFEGPMAEKGEITIPDITEDVFQLFLRYLYTDTIALTEMNVVPVLNVARKYSVDILLAQCKDFLIQKLSSNNVCMFLEQAHVFLMDEVTTECRKLIVTSSRDVLKSSAFTDLCPRCLTSITDSDYLCADEKDVYTAIISWAEAECNRQNLENNPENKRKVLGDILYTVRFPKIDSDFFLKRVCPDEVLQGDMALDIINCIMHKKVKDVPWLNTNDRKYTYKCTTYTERVWRPKTVLEGNRRHRGIPEATSITFKVSHTVKLYGIGSFLTDTEPSTVDVNVYEEGGICLYSGSKFPLVENDSTTTGDVLLTVPIQLSAGQKYNVDLEAMTPKYKKHNPRSHRAVKEQSLFGQHYSETGIENVAFKGGKVTFICNSHYSTAPPCQIPFLILGS